MTPESVQRLRSLYVELDRRVAAVLAEADGAPPSPRLRAGSVASAKEVACRACGRCCTFPPGSPVLYATALERAYLAAEPPPEGNTLSGRACPHLHAETMRCTARERRTVGCRTHFCDDALPSREAIEATHALCEWAMARLRVIASDCGLEWDYAPVVAGKPLL